MRVQLDSPRTPPADAIAQDLARQAAETPALLSTFEFWWSYRDDPRKALTGWKRQAPGLWVRHDKDGEPANDGMPYIMGDSPFEVIWCDRDNPNPDRPTRIGVGIATMGAARFWWFKDGVWTRDGDRPAIVEIEYKSSHAIVEAQWLEAMAQPHRLHAPAIHSVPKSNSHWFWHGTRADKPLKALLDAAWLHREITPAEARLLMTQPAVEDTLYGEAWLAAVLFANPSSRLDRASRTYLRKHAATPDD